MSIREIPWLQDVADFWEPIHQPQQDAMEQVLTNVAGYGMLPAQERARGAVDAAAAMGTGMAGEAMSGLLGLYEGAESFLGGPEWYGGGPFLDPAVAAIQRSREAFPYHQPETIGGQMLLGGAEAIEEPIRAPFEAGAEASMDAFNSPLLATGLIMVPEVIDALIPGKHPNVVRDVESSVRPTQINLIPNEFGEMEEPAGALSTEPYYSKLEDVIANAPQDRMTGKQWAGYLQKQGVKPDEMRWTGVGDELAGMGDDTVTRQELMRGLALEGGRVEPEIIVRKASDSLQFDENYQPRWEDVAMLRGPEYTEYQINLPEERFGKFKHPYRHWKDDNTLMHLRTTQRTLPNGETVFMIDEIQSDWHQKGRTEGYMTPEMEQTYKQWEQDYNRLDAEREQLEARLMDFDPDQRYGAEYSATDDSLRSVRRQLSDMRINRPKQSTQPEAPFKNNWFDLGMKLAISEAVKRGDSYVALPSGQYLKDAYDADYYVESIYYDPVNEEFVIDEHVQISEETALEAGIDESYLRQARDAAPDLDAIREDYIHARVYDDVQDRYDIEDAVYSEAFDMEFSDRDEARTFFEDTATDDVQYEIEREDYETDAEYEEAMQEWMDDRVEDLMMDADDVTLVYDNYDGTSQRRLGSARETRESLEEAVREDMEQMDNEDLLGEDYLNSITDQARIDIHDSIVDPNQAEIGGAVSFLENMVPGLTEKFVKKNKQWNTEVEFMDVPMGQYYDDQYLPVIRVTPEMRKDVKQRGQPLFLRPEIAAGGLGAGALAAQREEEEPKGALEL